MKANFTYHNTFRILWGWYWRSFIGHPLGFLALSLFYYLLDLVSGYINISTNHHSHLHYIMAMMAMMASYVIMIFIITIFCLKKSFNAQKFTHHPINFTKSLRLWWSDLWRVVCSWVALSFILDTVLSIFISFVLQPQEGHDIFMDKLTSNYLTTNMILLIFACIIIQLWTMKNALNANAKHLVPSIGSDSEKKLDQSSG